MKNLFLSLALLLSSSAFAVNITGPADSVIRVPHAGGQPKAGNIDLSQPAAVGSTVLGMANGGTNATSANAATSNLLAEPARNYLLNSDFRFNQRYGGSGSFAASNTTIGYVLDRWYIHNGLGTNGVLTTSQVAGTQTGSLYAMKLQITTAPTAAQANGTEVYQSLENSDSTYLYNKTASFGVQVKAFGNVNQVGLQFCYATSEAKCASFVGSETTCTVNSSTFTSCAINGQALGTAMTTAGSIGVRVRITAVSTGNTYDLNNGFSLEQAMVNLGSSVATYRRQLLSVGEELNALQRFFEKTNDLDSAAGTATAAGAWQSVAINGSDFYTYGYASYKVSKRSVPSITTWAAGGAGSINNFYSISGATITGNVGIQNAGTNGFRIFCSNGALTGSQVFAVNWAADSEI